MRKPGNSKERSIWKTKKMSKKRQMGYRNLPKKIRMGLWLNKTSMLSKDFVYMLSDFISAVGQPQYHI